MTNPVGTKNTPAQEQSTQFAPAMVPAKMHLDASVIRDLQFILGSADDGEPFMDGVLWVGTMPGDNSESYYGLHMYSSEYPEEGSITLATFDPVSDPSPRAQTLEEAARHLDDEAATSLSQSATCSDDMFDEFYDRSEYFKEAAASVRALSSQPVADHSSDVRNMVAHGLPQDVINLVIAAREAFEIIGYTSFSIDVGLNLDKALEAFDSRVPYENEPALPVSPGASE